MRIPNLHRALSLSVLSLLALSAVGCVSGQTHEMLRTAHAKLLEENKDLLADNALLKGRLEAQKNDRGTADADRARLEAERSAMDSQRSTMESELRRLRDELARAQANAANLSNTHTASADQLEGYRRRIADLEARLAAAMAAGPVAPPVGPLVDRPDVNEMVKKLAREFGLTYDERTGMLGFPADLLFPSGQDGLLAGADAPLRKLAAIIDHPQLRDFRIRIVGHTDKRPIQRAETATRFPTNWHLAGSRAIAVMAELIKYMEHGKDAGSIDRLKDRFEPSSRGQRDLIDQGNTEAAHRRNRRVEVFFVPPPQLTGRALAIGASGK